MGFIKNLFNNNESTVIGLWDLKRRQPENIIYETKSYVLNQLFMETPENNILLRRVI